MLPIVLGSEVVCIKCLSLFPPHLLPVRVESNMVASFRVTKSFFMIASHFPADFAAVVTSFWIGESVIQVELETRIHYFGFGLGFFGSSNFIGRRIQVAFLLNLLQIFFGAISFYLDLLLQVVLSPRQLVSCRLTQCGIGPRSEIEPWRNTNSWNPNHFRRAEDATIVTVCIQCLF